MGVVLVSLADSPVDDGRALRARAAAARAGSTVTDLSPRCWAAFSGPTPLRRLVVGPWTLIGEIIDRRCPSLRSISDHDGMAYEKKLIARFWGRYLGVRLDTEGALAAVLRDPSGGLECYQWTEGPVAVVASEAPDWLLQTLRPKWRIADDRISGVLQDPYSSEARLLLDGPVALAPGETTNLGAGVTTALWRPGWVAATAQPRTDDDAAEILRDAVDEAVTGFARLGGALAVEISGGLDSGIVASTVARFHRDKVRLWLNAWGPDASSDERPWVQALSDHLGVSPTLVPRATGRITRAFLENMPQGVRPGFAGLDGLHDADWAFRLEAAGIDRILTGKGGDGLFVQPADLAVYRDLWLNQGWRALGSPSLVGLSRLNERSVWTTIKSARTGRRTGKSPDVNPLIRQDWNRQAPPHPWLADVAYLGPAKRAQIQSLVQGIGFHGPSLQTRAVAVMHPLISQPVVEACLSLPTYQLTLGRRDRALARRAFADRLPVTITERRSKGEMTAFYGRMIADGLDVMKDWLLDGELAQRGLIDRKGAEGMLTREALAWRGGYVDIMTTAAVEGWVRAWARRLA